MKNRKVYFGTDKLLFFAISLVLLSSCSPMLKKLYGINELQAFDPLGYEIAVERIKKNYAGEIHFVLSDTTQYLTYSKLDFGKYQKTLAQPIQILYFERDTLRSYHANCFAKGGLTNLEWNVDNRFENFIPKSAIPIDSVYMPLARLSKLYNTTTDSGKTNVFIFWTNYLGKISHSAIEVVKNNIIKANK